MKPKADFCFEVSWEVANKVGGIYTVIKSKIRLMQKNYPSYITVGPYIKGRSELEAKLSEPPEQYKTIFDELKSEGIICYYGKWQVDGEPEVILVDASALRERLNDWKSFWWQNYQIDSLRSHWDFEEPMLWATAVGRVIQRFAENHPEQKVVAQFHEWLAGFGLLWLKDQKIPVATVFTTHATMLGRSVAGSGRDLYAELEKIDPPSEAKNLGVEDKWSTEHACAQHADVFTTVSAITGLEAEHFLGRKPDVLVLNGLDSDMFPSIEDISILHHDTREKMRGFFSYYFFPYAGQEFDLEHTLAFFMVARYEYHNKGIDIYLKALAKLNEDMKAQNSKHTVVAFVWVPSGVSNTRVELLESKNYFGHIRHETEWYSEDITRNVVRALISQKELTIPQVMPEKFLKAVKKDVWKFKRQGNPPMTTHYLNNEGNDEVVRACQSLGLDNRAENRVKVIFYPVYLDGNDGLLNLSYYDAMAACHLGVFPSYYEPWGYTPIEAAAMGVPSVTTDLAGCGVYMEEKLKGRKPQGIWVIKRRNKPEGEVVDSLFKIFKDFVKLEHQDRAEYKIAAKQAVDFSDWKELIHNYIQAHNLAVERVFKV